MPASSGIISMLACDSCVLLCSDVERKLDFSMSASDQFASASEYCRWAHVLDGVLPVAHWVDSKLEHQRWVQYTNCIADAWQYKARACAILYYWSLRS